MTNLQRIALSLLISVLVVAGFTFFAYSGLFGYIETKFYQQRVAELIENDVAFKAEKISEFHRIHFSRFDSLLSQLSVEKIFAPNWDREYIFTQSNLFEKLSQEYQGFLFARIVDSEGRIHYSTREEDVERRGEFRTVFKRLDDQAVTPSVDQLLLSETDESSLLIDDTGSRFIYQFPLFDDLDQFRGTALFYLAKSRLERFMVKVSALEADSGIYLGSQGYLFYGQLASPASLFDQKQEWWNTAFQDTRPVYESSGDGRRFELFTEKTGSYGYVGVLVDRREFQLSESLKIVLLIAGGLTLFLLLLLILSMRQDKEVILRSRLKRFQLQFIKEYLENKDAVSWRQMKGELGRKRNLLREDIKKGIGKVSPEKDKELDSLIDESWNDIFQVLDKRIEAKTTTNIDIGNLEELVQKIMTYQGPAAGTAPPQAVQTDRGPAPAEALEELEEFEEAEAGEEPEEELEEAEEAEALEELEEFEEAEEAEALEELEEFEEAEEAEALEEPEELEEAEEAEALEEPEEELEEVEEAEALEEPEEAETGEELAAIEEETAESDETLVETVDWMKGFKAEQKQEALEDMQFSAFEELSAGPTEKESREVQVEGLEEDVTSQEPEILADIEDAGELEEQVETVEPIHIGVNEVYSVDEGEFGLLERAVSGGEVFPASVFSHSISTRPVEGFLEVIDEREEIDEVEELTEEMLTEHAEGELSEMEDLEEIEELPENEELEEVQDFEELEEIEELEEAEEPTAPAELVVYSINELLEIVGVSTNESDQAIVFTEGTYQIDDQIYRESEASDDLGLKNLVGEVSGKEESETIPEEGEGIDSIIGFQSVDLPLDMIQQPSKIPTEKDSFSAMHGLIGVNGFNYDAFFSKYGTGSMKTLKTLMRISSKFGAVYAALLKKEQKKVIFLESVGFDVDMHGKAISFDKKGKFKWEEVRDKFSYYPMRNEKVEKSLPDELYDPKMKEHTQAVVLIPVLFEGDNILLYLGLKKSIEDPRTLIRELSNM